MNPYQFLKEIAGIPTGNATTGLGGGDGIKHEIQLNPIADFRTVAGLVLDGSTTAPQVKAVETNGLAVQAAASTTACGTFIFAVPKDYDPTSDILEIKLTAVSGGTTNAPTLTATAYNKRAGVALSSVLTVVASAAIPISTAFAAERTVSLSANKLLPDDILTINIVAAAHTTDVVNIVGCDIIYRSNVVLTDMAQR